MNIQSLRAETPGCAERIHLNNAGAALMPEPVVRTLKEHIDLESRIGGYEAEDLRAPRIPEAYRSVANLLGTQPRNIAFTENATVSNLQAISSIPFAAGDLILTTRNDYASNQIQFLSLQRRLGVRVVRAPDHPAGGVDLPAMADLIRTQKPKLVCVTHVPTNSGLVQDVSAIGAVCREAGIHYLVDACQSVGQMPLAVSRIQCDFLSASARKYLRGPRGSGFLFVSDRVLQAGLVPLFPDMRGADWIAENQYREVDDARRFENWEFSWALVLATAEAARYAAAIGLEHIQERVHALAARLRERLETVEHVGVLDRGRELCGIVSVAVDNHDPRQLVAALREQRINASAQIREYAVLDYDDKGVQASLRLSPHYYNTEEEIDVGVSALRQLVRQQQPLR